MLYDENEGDDDGDGDDNWGGLAHLLWNKFIHIRGFMCHGGTSSFGRRRRNSRERMCGSSDTTDVHGRRCMAIITASGGGGPAAAVVGTVDSRREQARCGGRIRRHCALCCSRYGRSCCSCSCSADGRGRRRVHTRTCAAHTREKIGPGGKVPARKNWRLCRIGSVNRRNRYRGCCT